MCPADYFLQLMVDTDGKFEWKDCAVIRGLRLPRGYHFGASSATGDLTGETVSMKNILQIQLKTPVWLQTTTTSSP